MIYVIFIIGIFESLFLSNLLFLKRNRSISDSLLGTELIILAINILASCLECYNSDQNFVHAWMINISSPIVMLHGPMLWLYCRSLTVTDFKFKSYYIFHIVPYLVILIYHVFTFYILGPEEKIALARSEEFASTFIYKFLLIGMIITLFSYLFSSLKLIQLHEKNILAIFSSVDRVNLYWLKMIIYSTILTFIFTYTIIFLNEIYHFATFKFTEAIGYCLGSGLILFLGFYGIRQTKIFTSYQPVIITPDLGHHAINSEYLGNLLRLIEEKKPYLDPNLTLYKLSELLNISETELSALLNNQLNKSFFDFVNSYRIEEFKNQLLISENHKLTLLGIAQQCGFSSKATFNRVFKKYTQLTPNEYKANLEKLRLI